MRPLAVLVASILVTYPLRAQDLADSFRGPDLGTDEHVHGIQILPAVGKPFTGRDHIEWTRKLEDGSVVTTELYALLARDSQGRIYREHRGFVPPNSSRESRLIDIVLLDPVTHTGTTCALATRRCTVTSYHVSATFTPPQPGSQGKGTRFLTREGLGTSVVDGLDVIGTRETLTFGAGAVGNTQPLVVTRDFWYSPALEVNLTVTRKDPRQGTQVIHIVDLSRTDPDPAIFRVPSNFVVEDRRSARPPTN
jgi:hypothetical protein